MKSETFKVGDRVSWETQKREGRDIVTTPFSGNITFVGKKFVIVNYAPDKYRQLAIGTLNLRKVGPAVEEPAEEADLGSVTEGVAA